MAIEIQLLTKEQILGLQDRLCSNQFQPLDFIKGLNPRPIHARLLDSLSQKALSDKNLCFRISDSNNELLILAEYLPWDSDHFGMSIARIAHIEVGDFPNLEFASKAIGLFLEEARRINVNYLFSSIDVRRKSIIQALTISRFIPIEFRAHYHIDLDKFSYPKRFKVRLANERDIDSLSETAARMENPYDRFFGEPVLDKDLVGEMLRIWIRKSITTSFADGVLTPDIDNPTAFCTFKTHQENWDEWGVKLSQPILAAVAPELSGWYLKVMSELSFHLKGLGAQRAYMTTQLGNLAVIRSWEALNYKFGGSEVVCRWSQI